MGVAGTEVLRLGMRNGATAAKAGGAFSEEFLTYYFKVTPCNRKYPHDWASCLCGHKGERANRRDLRTHSYLPVACEYAKQKLECPKGDGCPNSHNLFEYWLHPKRYKTEMCLFRANCDRPVCFFAHSAEELRVLASDLPPAELCWSAGAALPGKDGSSSGGSGREGRISHGSRGGAHKQSTQHQYQHCQQQKLQMQIQQAHQAMLRQGQDVSFQHLQQQFAAASASAQQQQPVFVQMPSGELAMLAPVGQSLQPQQQLVLDVSAQGLMALQTAGGAVLPAPTQVPGQQGHVPAVTAAAAVQQESSVLGTLLPVTSTVATSAAAAAGAGGSLVSAWGEQLLLDPSQQQQYSICATSSSLLPVPQHQVVAGVNSNACSPAAPVYQQTGTYTALASSSTATSHLADGPMYITTMQQQPLSTAASDMMSMTATAAGGAAVTGLGGYRLMQLQPDGLLGPMAAVQVGCTSACSSTAGNGSYANQLGSAITIPADSPAPSNLPLASMYSQGLVGYSQGFGVGQGVILNASVANQGLGMVPVSGVNMTAFQNAFQCLQI